MFLILLFCCFVGKSTTFLRLTEKIKVFSPKKENATCFIRVKWLTLQAEVYTAFINLITKENKLWQHPTTALG